MMSLERYICRVAIVLADLKTYLGSLFFFWVHLLSLEIIVEDITYHMLYVLIYILFGNKVVIRIQKSWFGFIT